MTTDQGVDKTPPPEPTISEFLSDRIESKDFPSSVYLIAEGDEIVFSDALGRSVVEPYSIATHLQIIYDLASLTKPLITTMLCARRIESGELALDDPVYRWLPEFNQSTRQMIRLRHLLTHSSGLPAWRPLYILAQGEPDRVGRVIAKEELESTPGTKVVYSDLGFIVLGLLLEKISGRSVAQLAQDEIFSALQLKHTFFNPDVALQTGIAACETGNVYEQETYTSAGMGEYKSSRKGLIWGEVHDGNAYFLGGAAGHAGLFSSASETLILAQQFLPRISRLLKPNTCKLARENLTAGMNEARSVGWQLAETKDSTAGPLLPPDSFGHTGFTGTSCWVDPNHERVFILLTNRTHNRLPPFVNINSTRRKFHSLAVQTLERRNR